MKIVCLADTHGMHSKLEVPYGDVLIHAGDFCGMGRSLEVIAFNEWLGTLPHPAKIVIAGNHDRPFERDPSARAFLTNAIYLQDSEVTVAGIRFYGIPWQPAFCNWAFNLQRGEELKRKWDIIPNGIDILITHGPPHKIGDLTLSGEMRRFTFGDQAREAEVSRLWTYSRRLWEILTARHWHGCDQCFKLQRGISAN